MGRAPPKVAAYVKELFVGSCVKLDIIDDVRRLEKEFPLFAAVNRAASGMCKYILNSNSMYFYVNQIERIIV